MKTPSEGKPQEETRIGLEGSSPKIEPDSQGNARFFFQSSRDRQGRRRFGFDFGGMQGMGGGGTDVVG